VISGKLVSQRLGVLWETLAILQSTWSLYSQVTHHLQEQ
jgi:hypothetical protein